MDADRSLCRSFTSGLLFSVLMLAGCSGASTPITQTDEVCTPPQNGVVAGCSAMTASKTASNDQLVTAANNTRPADPPATAANNPAHPDALATASGWMHFFNDAGNTVATWQKALPW